jgi:hypothetical protein
MSSEFDFDAWSEIRSPGRAIARTGLRMMPTFPWLPLKVATRIPDVFETFDSATQTLGRIAMRLIFKFVGVCEDRRVLLPMLLMRRNDERRGTRNFETRDGNH